METEELISTRNTLRPKFIYGSIIGTRQLHRINLLTGEQSTHQMPSYQFNWYSHWSELPGGSLTITGGSRGATLLRDVVKIDTLREWAVSSLPPMHTARRNHAAVYHSQYLYVLGWKSGRYLSECEVRLCRESMGRAACSACSFLLSQIASFFKVIIVTFSLSAAYSVVGRDVR
jgi:hypothetical protein